MNKEDLRIVFMGTPEFAVPSLKLLCDHDFNIVGVITAPDRPAGRGRKIKLSPIKEYALENGLHLYQPTNLKDEHFIALLSSLKANLQIVVAFRMLPKVVWDMPELGTFNLHASLLPQYRGAAPINYAIINGEMKTGLTTFFIDEKIDTGRIIKQCEMEIGEQENFGELHDRMKEKGASLIHKTVDLIISGKAQAINQDAFLNPNLLLKPAPKIFKEDCKINWSKSVVIISNLIRGLSPIPGAYSILSAGHSKNVQVKIYRSSIEFTKVTGEIGKIITDNLSYLKIAASDGYINVLELQIEGKRRTNVEDFLRGNKILDHSFFF